MIFDEDNFCKEIVNNSHCQDSHSLPKRIKIFKIWVTRFCPGRREYNRDMRNRKARMGRGGGAKGRGAGKRLNETFDRVT